MRINPLTAEGLELLGKPGFRRVYGLALFVLTGAFFLILPSRGPGGGAGFTGAPPVYGSMAAVSAVVTLSAFIFSLSLLTGRGAEASGWLKHTGPLVYAAGKMVINLLISILYGVLILPFLILALYFEALPLGTAFAAAGYLAGIFLSYCFLLEVLNLIFGGFPVLRRVILWCVFGFHLILSSGLAPEINPVIRLTFLAPGLLQATIMTGLIPLLVLIPVFLVLTFLKAGRKDG